MKEYVTSVTTSPIGYHIAQHDLRLKTGPVHNPKSHLELQKFDKTLAQLLWCAKFCCIHIMEADDPFLIHEINK